MMNCRQHEKRKLKIKRENQSITANKQNVKTNAPNTAEKHTHPAKSTQMAGGVQYDWGGGGWRRRRRRKVSAVWAEKSCRPANEAKPESNKSNGLCVCPESSHYVDEHANASKTRKCLPEMKYVKGGKWNLQILKEIEPKQNPLNKEKSFHKFDLSRPSNDVVVVVAWKMTYKNDKWMKMRADSPNGSLWHDHVTHAAVDYHLKPLLTVRMRHGKHLEGMHSALYTSDETGIFRIFFLFQCDSNQH